MDPIGERVQSAKRPKPDLGPSDRQETPWSPFLPKRSCLVQADSSEASPSLSNIPTSAVVRLT